MARSKGFVDPTRHEYIRDWSYNNEPSMLNFKAHGLLCRISRHPFMGHLCGYVGVPLGHPLYGLKYNHKVEPSKALLTENYKGSPVDAFIYANAGGPMELVEIAAAYNVHGGITFAGLVPYGRRVKNTWWFGFDCAHSGDLLPHMEVLRGPGSLLHDIAKIFRALPGYEVDVYRDLAYVKNECYNLAAQLAGLMP